MRISQSGSVAVEAVVIIPIAMVVILFAVQACLWAHAAALVQNAAAEGDQAACDVGGSVQAGTDRARQFLTSAASSVVANPEVTSAAPSPGEIEIRVQGTAESVVPWLHVTVSAVRRGTVQEFRSGE